MPDRPRLFATGVLYHVTVRGNQGQKISLCLELLILIKFGGKTTLLDFPWNGSVGALSQI
jgi:hypothetical protein